MDIAYLLVPRKLAFSLYLGWPFLKKNYKKDSVLIVKISIFASLKAPVW